MTDGAASQFGARLASWLREQSGADAVRERTGKGPAQFLAEIAERLEAANSYLLRHPQMAVVSPWAVYLAVLFNDQVFEVLESDYDDVERLRDDPSEYFAAALASAATGGPLREVFETIGATIYDTSTAAITGRRPPTGDAADRARSFVGYVTALAATPQVLASILEALSVGQIDQFGYQVQQVYYNLGLGFLTWQTMAPILQAAILEPLERDVQRQWRGKRFSQSQLQELYALGEIDGPELVEGLREEGWPEDSIELVQKLAYRALTRSDIFQAYYNGAIPLKEAVERLRGLGYDPRDIPLLFNINQKDDVEDDRKESVSTLTRALREGLLTEPEYREAMEALNYSEREVDLRVQITRAQQEAEVRRLSVAQLRDAWEVNQVGDPEAIQRLTEMGYPSAEAGLIVETWRVESEPEFRKINQATTLAMYRYAVLTRGGARDTLVELGYSAESAEALLDLEEARHPEAFGAPPARRARFLSARSLQDLYQMGRIDEARLRQGVEALGFSGDDAEHQVFLLMQPVEGGPRPLSQSTIEEAYVTGVFDRTTAAANLQDLGFSAADAETILDTVEATNPAVFAPETVTAVRQPSISALIEALRNGFIDEVEYFRRAVEIGFTRDGAAVYLANSRAGAKKGTKSLTKADVMKLYREGLFGYSEALEELEGMGYSYRDADLLLRAEMGGVENSDIWQAMLSGLIEPTDAANMLVALGFGEDDVIAAFKRLTGGVEA